MNVFVLCRSFWMGLVFLFCAVASLSAEQFGLFTYEVVGGSVTITDYPDNEVGDVEIPATIDGRRPIGGFEIARSRKIGLSPTRM